jgi:RNA polymerase sigma factor (sigma-70 family)
MSRDGESTQPSLLSRVRDPADREAWREFEARYGNLIVGYARRCGLQLCDAEDVRQNVLLNLSRSMPGFRYLPARGRFRSYLGKAVRGAVVRHQARHTAAQCSLSNDVLQNLAAADSPEFDGLWEQEWLDHHCRLAMNTLRRTCDPQTLVIFERLLGGESAADIARSCQLTPEAVRQAKQRVKERLRGIVAAQIQDEDADA